MTELLTQCPHCKGSGKIKTKRPDESLCPECGHTKIELIKGRGWYCKKCNTGPYIIVKDGRLKLKEA